MNSWQYLSDSSRIPRIFVTLSYLYRNRILERHDLDKKKQKFHESSRILTFINSWRFVGFVVCVEWGHTPFCNLFADDSVFYAQAPTINSAQVNLQNDINNVVEWFNNKYVEIIVYGGKHPPKFFSIYAVN